LNSLNTRGHSGRGLFCEYPAGDPTVTGICEHHRNVKDGEAGRCQPIQPGKAVCLHELGKASFLTASVLAPALGCAGNVQYNIRKSSMKRVPLIGSLLALIHQRFNQLNYQELYQNENCD